MVEVSKSDREFHRRCGEVLHYLWDPIGVAGAPGARDEYDSYLPSVVALVRSGADPQRIADHLTRITVESMGLRGNNERALEVANVLLEWREWLSSHAS